MIVSAKISNLQSTLIAALFATITISCDPAPHLVNAPSRGGDVMDACKHITPAPRWVLRDKNNERVEAMVEPRCGNGLLSESNNRCNSINPGATVDFPCVRIVDHAGRYINLQYDLLTGSLGPCQGTPYNVDFNTTWESLAPVFVNDKCEGERHTSQEDAFAQPEFADARDLYYVEGQMWYLGEAGCIHDKSTFWSIDAGECKPFEASHVCPYRPVPKWVEDLLPDAPYTMAVEYE